MKTSNTILAILAAIGLLTVVIIEANRPDDLNGYMPGSFYVHSRIPTP